MVKNLRKFISATLVLILCLSFSVTGLAKKKSVVATVNGVDIAREELVDFMLDTFGHFALEELIQKELLKQKAAEINYVRDETKFQEVYQIFIQQLGGPQGLQMFLLQNNITEDQFMDQVEWNYLISDLAKAEVTVTDEELAEWFELHSHYFDQPEYAEVSHILVDEEDEALELIARLEAGEDFEEIAQEYSLDPGSAAVGGYLGQIERGLTVAEFEEASFSQEIGKFGLTESQFGWHIVLVHDRKEAKPASFDELYKVVKDSYLVENSLEPQEFLRKLQSEAKIEIFDLVN